MAGSILKKLPEIPDSWIILGIAGALVILRAFNIDTWVTSSLSIIIGYLTGVKMEQTRKCVTNGNKT